MVRLLFTGKITLSWNPTVLIAPCSLRHTCTSLAWRFTKNTSIQINTEKCYIVRQHPLLKSWQTLIQSRINLTSVQPHYSRRSSSIHCPTWQPSRCHTEGLELNNCIPQGQPDLGAQRQKPLAIKLFFLILNQSRARQCTGAHVLKPKQATKILENGRHLNPWQMITTVTLTWTAAALCVLHTSFVTPSGLSCLCIFIFSWKILTSHFLRSWKKVHDVVSENTIKYFNRLYITIKPVYTSNTYLSNIFLAALCYNN